MLLVAMATLITHAAAPSNYYQSANNKKGEALKTAMRSIIYNRTEKSYDYLWTAFYTTDVRDGDKVWDMYSNYNDLTLGDDQDRGSGNAEGQYYNREHSFPQSWFGSNTPMYTDLHHIYPTDKFVNGKRSNYPFGETTGNKYKSQNNFSKLGNCTDSDYSGIVFEPADQYKGDFARTYFYMVTCYEEKLHDWFTNYSSTDVVHVLDGSTYPGLQLWQLNMLLKWAANDRVSQKEIDRNNAVYGIQGNRNPFIDYPGLEQYIWGSKKDDAFSYNNYVTPTTWSTEYNEGSGSGQGQGGETTGDYYAKVTSINDIESGGTFLIVYEGDSKALNGALTSFDVTGNTISVTISDNKITATSTINESSFTITTVSGGYSIKSASGYYIGNTSSSSNALSSSTTTAYANTITFENENVNITNNNTYLRYNSASDQARFRYFKASSYSSQQAIQLYKLVENTPTTINPIFNNLSDLRVNYSSTLTLTKGTSGSENFVTNGTATLTSLNTNVVTVSGLTITPVAVGTALIIVNTSATTTYNAGEKTFPITVVAPEGQTTAMPAEGEALLFGESFGDNSGSARDWSDSYSVKSGVSDVYSGITGYNITNAKQSKNTVGSTASGLMQTTQGTDASIIIGPLNVADYEDLRLIYQWKAGSIKGSYSTSAYYATSANGTYTSLTGTGTGATTFVERSYSLPAAAQVSTLYLKIVWNTSNTQAVIDEVQLFGSSAASIEITLNSSGYATYCSEYPLDFSGYETADYSAWQITGVSGQAITFSQITGSVKGGTGILLKGEGNATITLSSADSDNTLDDNLLYGTLAPTYVGADEYYGLSGTKFVKVNPGTVKAGKALLPASVVGEVSDVKALAFVFEETDQIESLTTPSPMGEKRIFNLAGQRLSKPQKGVNIINGKKVIIK